MKQPSAEKPNYGNWVSTRLIYVPGVVSLIFMGLAIIFPFLLVVAALILFVSLYFAYARYLFSPQGGNVQDRVRGLVLSNLDWNGKGQILDIGCGSASLTIALAKKYKGAQVIGIDYWGKQWEYSKKVCEKCKGKKFHNAALTRCHKGSYPASFVYAVESWINHTFGKYDSVKP